MSRIKKKNSTPRNVVVKLMNTKEKQPEKKRSVTSEARQRLTADFSQEMVESRRQRNITFEVQKELPM